MTLTPFQSMDLAHTDLTIRVASGPADTSTTFGLMLESYNQEAAVWLYVDQGKIVANLFEDGVHEHDLPNLHPDVETEQCSGNFGLRQTDLAKGGGEAETV